MMMDLDLSLDAAPLSVYESEDQHRNSYSGSTYSFIDQIFSPNKRDYYKRKSQSIKLKNPGAMGPSPEFGDVLMTYYEDDFEAADRYCNFLKTLVMRSGPSQNGVAVKASLIHNQVLPGSSIFTGLKDASSRFTFIFLYVSKNSHMDELYKYMQEMFLYQQLTEEEKEDTLVLVRADDVIPDDIPPYFKPLMTIMASDRSKDITSALIKKLESKLYVREAKEMEFMSM